MTGRLRIAAWWAAIGFIGWLCTASLVDRLAGAGVLVGDVGANSGRVLFTRAELARQAGDAAAAERLAGAGLRRRPIDAVGLRIAAMAALDRGDAVRGETLMRLAGAAGWRDVPTQLFWARTALAQGAPDVAAQRLEAVARVGDASAQALLQEVETSVVGRTALARQWDGAAPWLPTLLGTWPAAPQAVDHRVALLQRLGRRIQRADLDRIVGPMMVQRRYDLTFALLHPDETMLRFGIDPGPLDWQLLPGPGIDAEPLPDGRLRVVASGATPIPVAMRLVRFALGTSRLDIRVSGARTEQPLLATLTCAEPDGTGDIVEASASRNRLVFGVRVDAGCPYQTLMLTVAGAEARRGAELMIAPPRWHRVAAAP